MSINKDAPFSDALLPRLCYLYPDLTNINHTRLHHLDDFYPDSDFASYFTMSDDRDTVSDYQDELADVLHPLPTHFTKPCSDPLPSHTPPRTPERKALSMPEMGGSKPTPVHPKGSGMLKTRHGTIDQATKKYIDLTLIPHVKRDFTVLAFVKHVWKYDPQRLLDVLNNLNEQNINPSLSGARCRRYWARAQMHEKMMYDELCGIFEDLLQAIDDQRSIPAKFINMREHTIEGNYGSYKPDISYSVVSDRTKPRWEWTLSCVEVKRNGGKFDCNVQGDVPIDVNRLKELIENPPVRGKNKRKDAPHEEDELSVVSERPRKRARSHDTVLPGGPQTRKRKEPSENFDQPEPPMKRSRSHAEEAGAEDAKVSESEVDIGDAEQLPEFKQLTATERQAVKYELEMMSHGVRSYSSGLTVDGLTVHLWYADRMGLIKSEPFNFVEEPHILLLVLAAMGSADLATMGISPFLTFGQSGFQSYDDAHLEIPDQQAIDVNGRVMGALDFEVDTSRGLLTDFGIVGRGTTVVPVKTTANSAQFGDAALVAKMSWQPQERASEASLIRLVRQSLGKKPNMLQHIVDLKCSVTRSMEAVGLPRAFLPDARLESPDTRELRLLVLTKYEPLQSVCSVDEFKKADDDVIAHHYVWEYARVLHRDISVDNIMFHRSGDSVCGVLCDWDLALHKPDGDSDQLEFKMLVEMPKKKSNGPTEEPRLTAADSTVFNGEAKATDGSKDQAVETPEKNEQTTDGDKDTKRKPRYRTGTGPYMALDLLTYGSTPYHRYRHDLESFFFLLAWFCALFDPEQHKFRETGLWEANTLVDIGRVKRDFLHEPEDYKKTMAKAHPKYAALAQAWVFPLQLMVARANTGIRELRGERFHILETGETAELPMCDILLRAQIRKRNQVMTYEKFMKCLGAEP
ncbi:hypothetical protein BKA93DRAFT_927729 [Sparassis latifolia]